MHMKEPALKVADEVWIATALLHRENPDRLDFAAGEIIQRASAENIAGELRKGVSVHAYLHCVANLPPNSAQYRMLYETKTGKSTRRLFRENDEAHPKRHGKITPAPDEIPPKYRYLLDWYRSEYAPPAEDAWLRSVVEMIGSGKDVFAGANPDEYVRRLREGWE